MNDFVNLNQRGVALPSGKKDLIDLLPKPGKAERGRKVREPVESFVELESYLVRLLHSDAKERGVIISSVDYQEGLHVSHVAGQSRLTVVVQPRAAAKEAQVLDLLHKNGIAPLPDEDDDILGIDAWCCMIPLPVVVTDAATLIRDLLQQVFGLAEDAGLIYTYHEQNAA